MRALPDHVGDPLVPPVLEISLYTVSAHMRRICTKLGVGSRAAMVAALSDNPDLYTAD